MTIEAPRDLNSPSGKQVYVGDIDLGFSYSTLIGFAVPGFGRVTCENRWSRTTGEHINAFGPALYERIPRAVFERMAEALDEFFSGNLKRFALLSRLEALRAEAGL